MYTRSPIFVTRIRTTDTNSTTFIAIVNYPLPSSSSESRSSYHPVLFIRRNAPVMLFARIQHLLINPSWTRHRQQCVARQRRTQQRRDRTNRALNRRPQQREHAVSLQNTPDFWNTCTENSAARFCSAVCSIPAGDTGVSSSTCSALAGSAVSAAKSAPRYQGCCLICM